MQGSVNYVAGAEKVKCCFVVWVMGCWQLEVKIMALFLFLLGLVGALVALQLCPCLGCSERWQRFLPCGSRPLCDRDGAINSQSTLESRPPGCNQLTLHVLMCRASPWRGVCAGSRSQHPLLSPMPALGASAALLVALFQQLWFPEQQVSPVIPSHSHGIVWQAGRMAWAEEKGGSRLVPWLGQQRQNNHHQ